MSKRGRQCNETRGRHLLRRKERKVMNLGQFGSSVVDDCA